MISTRARRAVETVVLMTIVMMDTFALGRLTFLPGALTSSGDIDFARYDLSSPYQGRYKRNATSLLVDGSHAAYYTAKTVPIGPFTVTLVDHFSIPLFRNFPCVVTMELVDYPVALSARNPQSVLAPRSQFVLANAQFAFFDGIVLSQATVGVYTVHFRAVHANRTRNDVQGSFSFAIVAQFSATTLEVVRAPAPFSNAFAPLSRQPMFRLADINGNTVYDVRAQGTITALPRMLNGSYFPDVINCVVNNQISFRNGLAVFDRLQLFVPPALRGSRYLLEFVYVPLDRGFSILGYNATIQSSFCNSSVLAPIVYTFPRRFFSANPFMNVTIRGAVFPFQLQPHLRCRIGDDASSIVTFLDECNVNCSVGPSSRPVGEQGIALSLDDGVSWSVAGADLSVIFLGVDSALRIIFDDPVLEATGKLEVNPLGNTKMGDLTLAVADERNNDMLNYTSQTYSVLVSSPNLQMSGTFSGSTNRGIVHLANYVAVGFPVVLREYSIYASAHNLATGESLFGTRSISLVYFRNSSCVPPPKVTAIASSGCRFADATNMTLRSCGSQEAQLLTVYGQYFGLSGAMVYIGSTACTEVKHDGINIGSQLNCKCRFPPRDSNLTVVVAAQLRYVTPVPAIVVAPPVVITSVVGCPRNVFPSTGGCFTNTSTRITVSGSGFGASGASVFLNHIFTSIVIRCSNVTHVLGMEDTLLSCSIPVALGVGLLVTVRNAQTGQLSVPNNYASISYLASSGVLCKTDSQGYFCSQRGTCFLQNGTCDCVANPTSGFWAGEFCQTCMRGYYGAVCLSPCPTCSPTSVCDDGVAGSGRCVCAYGWGGSVCNIPCPGGSVQPCTNHGTCNSDTLTCTCQSSPDTGFWTGTTCNTCLEGYSGATCQTVCPRANNRVCNGHGTCIDGTCKCAQNYCDSACNVSFTGCSGCQNGTYGKYCNLTCPGGVNNICFGNGFCSDGPFGNGLCTCYEGWGGPNCTVTCLHGPSNLCSGHGTCNVDTGVCTCEAGYTLADCGTECPGGANNSCSGHGTCSVENSTCTCDFGYSGVSCGVPCPGGTTAPCSLHGVCLQNTTCSCFSDSFNGHWSGESCGACEAEWWGSQCRQQCPFAYGQQCGGHGQCSNDVVCTCYRSSTTGFWSGQDCAECSYGYYGTGCVSECPGSACNPCYGRGNCSQGVAGTGLCSCDSGTSTGFWSGVVCDACAAGFFGDNCTSVCPQGLQNLTCSNRGVCSDGRTGSGTCMCSGTFGGSVCSVCAYGYYGVNCAFQCPGPDGQPCLRRGVCENTENSTGLCSCDVGFGGPMCEFACPLGPYGICNGQGTCLLKGDQTAMVCVNCSSSALTGFWTGDSCSDCQPGYYGSLCKTPCPGGATSPCNNRGTCSDGYYGSGACACTFGYAGLSCEKVCVGGALIPCSGHGACDAVTGECTCNSDRSSGYWVGSSCDQCDAQYLSSTCTVPCPTTISNTSCSGHGICFQGVCMTCSSGYCGPTCSNTVGCVNCPAGTWGTSCTDCPGGRTNPCSGNGTCIQGVYGTGFCACNLGYRGTNCSVRCPGPLGVACYGRGTCTDSGTCICASNWAGADCNTPCNGFDQRLVNSTSCSGVGTCNKIDGSCRCQYGFGGSYCQIPCPGTSGPCNNRGLCQALDGTCSCYQNATIGYWNGPSCNYCQPDYYGSTCSKKCYQGGSDATFTQCVCHPYWSGEGCDIPCPGLLNDTVCYGHGTCTWGRDAHSLCTCQADWYDPNCLTYCTKAGCNALLVNGQCNVLTGICECQFSSAGHWDYTTPEKKTCEVCQVYYFGQVCENPCACSRHGTCDRRTGACTCYANAAQGYWGGSSCATCADGYIGVRCQSLNVAISPLGTVAAAATVPALDVRMGVICRDPLYPFVYIGTSPVSVLSASDQPLGTLQLGGFALNCVYHSSRELYIVTFTASRTMLNVINRQNAEYLRTEYVPLPAESLAAIAAATSSEHAREWMSLQRLLFQFEPTNVSSLNGAVMSASTILSPFSGVSDDFVITAFGIGVVQYYQISSGIRITLQTGFYSILDAEPVGGYPSLYSIAALVGDAASNHWEVALVDNSMPASAAASLSIQFTFYSRYGAYVSSVCPTCVPSRIFCNGSLVILIFQSPGIGMYLTRMDLFAQPLPYNATTAVNETSFAMQYFYGSVCTVTATAIDAYVSNGYFAMSCGSDPSVIMKFQLSTCLVTGTINLARVGADVETVVRLAVSQEQRTLEALTPLSRSQRVQKVSLYAVSDLSPLVADTKGGTLITVTGEGFVEGMQCVFNGDSSVDATFINPFMVHCVAPAGGTVACAGEPVEVALPGAGSTNNGQLLQRVASATIHELVNEETSEASGFLLGSNISVFGSGFVLPSDATLLLCRLFAPLDAAANVTVPAVFISSYEVFCRIPPLASPLPKPSYLEVSIDGSVFSDSQVNFDILGSASSLFISSPLSGDLTVQASTQSTLPPVLVNVADEAAHPLGKYTKEVHSIRVSLPPTSTFLLSGVLELSTTNGTAVFANINIVKPTVGVVQLIFTDTQLLWNTSLTFVVIEGEPYQMYFDRYPSSSVTNDNPTLSEQPIVGILDSSGNALSSLENKHIVMDTITLSYSYHDLQDDLITRAVGVPQLNAKFRVEGVSITGKHQQAYFLTFTAPQLSVSTLVSPPITVGWCTSTEFAIENSTQCKPCPPSGVCDGTFEIRAQTNWWRADSTTLQFYFCGAPYSGDSCYNNSQCLLGYHGPRCSLCDVGYGRSGRFCVKCQSSTTNSAVVVVAIMALLLVITLMVYSIVMTSAQDLLPVLFRNLVTYVQILARLSDTRMPWPSLLDTLWATISRVANLQAIDFSPFDCAMQADFFQKYVYTLIIPWGMIALVAPLAIIVVRLYTREETETLQALRVAAKCREDEDAVLLKEIRMATAQRRATMLGEASRRHPNHNPLDATHLPQPEGMDSVLSDEILKSVAESEAHDRINDWSSEALTKNRIDHVQHILHIRQARYAPGAVIVVTAVTIFTLLYPTLVQSSGQVLQCETMDLGGGGVQRISSNQRDVSCDSSYYHTYYTLSISMIMVYGVSIPLGLIAVVQVLRRVGGISLARAVLAFFMAGFKPELWFWESVNMGRKFMAMFVVVFVLDAKLQMIVFMWVIVVGFVLSVTFAPYTSQTVYALECLGMAATVVTMNLVLMFFFLVDESGGYADWRSVAISLAIILVNAIATMCYLVVIAQHSWLRFSKWKNSPADVAALKEIVEHRVTAIEDFAGEVHELRIRRAKLDQAIENIEERLDDVEENVEMKDSKFHNWQFPIDEKQEDASRDDEDSSNMSSFAPSPLPGAEEKDQELSKNQEHPATPVSLEESLSARKAQVTFAQGEDVIQVPSQRRSARKTDRSGPKDFKEFTVTGQFDVVRRTSSANTFAWIAPHDPSLEIDEDELVPGELDPGRSKQASATPTTTRSTEVLFDTRELLAALGNDEEDTHSNPMQILNRKSSTGSNGHQRGVSDAGALTADALRRLQGDASRAAAAFALGDSNEDPTTMWPQLDPQMLLASDSESQGDHHVGRHVAPPSKQAVVDRITHWQQSLPSNEGLDTPSTHSFPFEHHYYRDEEAEVEFLEGRVAEPPPERRAIFTQDSGVQVLDMRRELSDIDLQLAKDFEELDEEYLFVPPSFDVHTPSVGMKQHSGEDEEPLFVFGDSSPRRSIIAWSEPKKDRDSLPHGVDEYSDAEEDVALPRVALKVLKEVDEVTEFHHQAPVKTTKVKNSFMFLLGSDSDDEDDASPPPYAPQPILQPLGVPQPLPNAGMTFADQWQHNGMYDEYKIEYDDGDDDSATGIEHVDSGLFFPPPLTAASRNGDDDGLQPRPLHADVRSSSALHFDLLMRSGSPPSAKMGTPTPRFSPKPSPVLLSPPNGEMQLLTVKNKSPDWPSLPQEPLQRDVQLAEYPLLETTLNEQGAAPDMLTVSGSHNRRGQVRFKAMETTEVPRGATDGSLSLSTQPTPQESRLAKVDVSFWASHYREPVGATPIEDIGSAVEHIFDVGGSDTSSDEDYANTQSEVALPNPDADNDDFVGGAVQYVCNVPLATRLPSVHEMFLNPRMRLADAKAEALGDGGETEEGCTYEVPLSPLHAFSGPATSSAAGRDGAKTSTKTVRWRRQEPEVANNDGVVSTLPMVRVEATSSLDNAFLQEILEAEKAHGDVVPSWMDPVSSSTGSYLPPLRPLIAKAKNVEKKQKPPPGPLDTQDEVVRFLDDDTDDTLHSEVMDAPDVAMASEEPWFVRAQQSSGEQPVRRSPPPVAIPSAGAQATTSHRDRKRTVGFGKFRRASLSGAALLSNEPQRPLTPLVVDWDEEEGRESRYHY